MSDHTLQLDTEVETVPVATATSPTERVDIFAEITTVLKKQGHPKPEAWLDSKFTKQAMVLEGDAQIKMISRHFRLAMADVEENTQHARFGLMATDDNIVPKEFLHSFETNVAPMLVKHAV